MKSFAIGLIAIVMAFMVTAPVMAEGVTRLGPWEVRYNAFNSTLLRPEMADQYDLERSQYLATLNIVVFAAEEPGKPAQQVELSGYAMNPLSQQQQLEFQEVIEGESVYYLAQTRFTNAETLRFFITIEQGETQEELTFSKTFMAN
ncbi:hypothetical protein IDSA_10705 [Pseudidiomarina salinarum]|uniref:DUF4426 domain-containing protein n=2 Tax=Pseudidiomarina salinarum TaxID=435908 RepID=A0A094JCB9_9GAMM|nr:hypothetical protein IDSA_10705 [Pseudidiomarina salinarum]